jgi:hypothetical protein
MLSSNSGRPGGRLARLSCQLRHAGCHEIAQHRYVHFSPLASRDTSRLGMQTIAMQPILLTTLKLVVFVDHAARDLHSRRLVG